jgi:hypothetical protein
MVQAADHEGFLSTVRRQQESTAHVKQQGMNTAAAYPGARITVASDSVDFAAGPTFHSSTRAYIRQDIYVLCCTCVNQHTTVPIHHDKAMAENHDMCLESVPYGRAFLVEACHREI